MAPRSEVNRNDEIMTAWSASAASSVGLAPTRSATIPVPIRPKMEESPEAPRMPAAAILVIPWAVAWGAMWKGGPGGAGAARGEEAEDGGEPRGAEDAGGGHLGDPLVDGMGDDVEERARVGRAA